MAKTHSQLGFTLIELIVTSLIILMLAGAGIAAYNSFNQTQIIKQAGANLKNNIRFAQSKALNGEKVCGPAACGGNDDICGNEDDEKSLSGWQIKFSLNSYELSGLCGTTDFSKKTYLLPVASANQQLSFSPIPADILFNPISGSVTNSGDICLIDSNNRKYKLSISGSGEVKDYGLVTSCP